MINQGKRREAKALLVDWRERPGVHRRHAGALLYRYTAQHMRIYDMQHGDLVRTLEVPNGIVGSTYVNSGNPPSLMAVDPSGQQVVAATVNGLSIFTFANDPLSISQANLSGSQLTVLGSGFANGCTLRIDASTNTTPTVTNSQQLTVSIPALPAGTHNITVTNSNGDTYTLWLAFTT